ncbi:ATP-binding cassette domain-containing protein [Streptomyces sp. NPDC050516]|uniref:ATP-binding cassette domain-containing protein n=1 Tax=Streptomyces sp. NPDC050516 TaxID=3365621 RepID=UPI0037AA13D7
MSTTTTLPATAVPAGAELALNGAELGHPGGPPVLGALDLRVAPGKVLTVVGPSGCGKSTLLRTLAGLLPVLAGEATQAPRSAQRTGHGHVGPRRGRPCLRGPGDVMTRPRPGRHRASTREVPTAQPPRQGHRASHSTSTSTYARTARRSRGPGADYIRRAAEHTGRAPITYRTTPWPRTAPPRPPSPTPRGWGAGATSGPSPSGTSGAT